MIRRLVRLRAACALMVLAAPLLAGAAVPGNMAVDFSKGDAHALYAKVNNVAWGLLFFFYVLTLAVEIFRPGTEAVRLGPPTQRAILIAVALLVYPMLAGTILKSTQALADTLGPKENVFSEWYRAQQALQSSAIEDPAGSVSRAPGAKLRAGIDYPSVRAPWPKTRAGSCPAGLVAQDTAMDDPAGPQVDWTADADVRGVEPMRLPAWRCVRPEMKEKDESWIVSGVKDATLSAALMVIFAIMTAAKFLVEMVGSILTAVFYLLGPLAVSAGALKLTGTFGAWLKAYITYALWPAFTGLVMNLVIAVTAKPIAVGEGYADAIWISLAVMLSMLSVPSLVSQITGAAGAGFMSAALSGAAGYAVGAAKGSGTLGLGAIAGAAGDGHVVGALAKAILSKDPAAALGQLAGSRLGKDRDSGGSVTSVPPRPPT